jgi:membrane protease YdiL (CAAX protease family)
MDDPLTGRPGRPDAVDAVRVLAIALLARVGVLSAFWLGAPREVLAPAQAAVFLLVPLLYARLANLPVLGANGAGRVRLAPLGLALMAAAGSMWLVKGLSDLQTPVFRWLGLESSTANELERIKESVSQARRQGTVYEIFLFVVASPLGEEMLFRGIAFRGMAARFGFAGALAVTAPLFAVLHGTQIQMAVMLFLGVFWGMLVGLTGSVWSGVLAHAANNLTVLMMTGRYGDRLEELHAPLWALALSGLIFAGSMALLTLEYRRRRLREERWR